MIRVILPTHLRVLANSDREVTVAVPAGRPVTQHAPAVAAAIHDATGVWLSEQPMTPERVLGALAGSASIASSPPQP